MEGLPISLNLLLLLSFILLGWLYGKNRFKNKVSLESREAIRTTPMIIIASLLFIFVNITFFLLSLSSTMVWNLPLLLDYHWIRLIWGLNVSLLAFVCASITILALLTKHQQRWMLLLSVILIVVGVELSFWGWTRPIASSLTARVAPDGTILQTSGSSCAAAVCANISCFYGVKRTEQEMARRLGTTIIGTRAAQIVYGMTRFGFICHKIQTTESDLKLVTPPAVLFVDHPATGPESHIIGYMGHVDATVEIIDPLVGKVLLDMETVRQRWRGKAIEIK